jgi:large subunit ribosomal protein L10
MMLKKEKVAYVKKIQKEIKTYKTIAIMPIDGIPDRLVQKAKNTLKPHTKFIVARKTLINKILEGDEKLMRLMQHMEGNFALILSNDEPDKLNEIISGNKIKLGAKPNQISPLDIMIESGETSIAPGQAVTDLKTAGIDVQIQKGKVVISKSKTLVAKGAKISGAIAKALKMLDIQPFSAGTKLRVVLYDNILFTEQALSINRDFVTAEIARSFSQAHSLTMAIGYITPYNVNGFIGKAYMSALGLGLSAKIYEPEVSEKLLAQAVLEAVQIKSMVKEEKKEEPAKEAEPTPEAPK